jgi:protein-L-isoaspartate(D-aspartate) O-methyltransferase
MKTLINNLIEEGVLKKKSIIEAFERIDRKDFVLPEYIDKAYCDYPFPIGYGQTISQPLTVAFMFELLNPKVGDKILDVGSGSGWTTALLSEIVKDKGFVYGIEIVPELVKFSKDNLLKYNFKNLEIRQARKEIGLKEKAPFDKILVSASAQDIPNDLLKQLKKGGTMVMPVGNSILKIKKISDTKKEIDSFEGFVFVPLK